MIGVLMLFYEVILIGMYYLFGVYVFMILNK